MRFLENTEGCSGGIVTISFKERVEQKPPLGRVPAAQTQEGSEICVIHQCLLWFVLTTAQFIARFFQKIQPGPIN